jgi:glyoxylase-like metal-dependent hydrolase (beta-lactamase superfamily II)
MEIIDGVHVIDLGMVYAYLYREADRLTLIDTGLSTSADRIVQEIEAIGRQPGDLRQIVVTHYHADHAGSAEEIAVRTGAQVLVHTLDAPVVRGDAEETPPRLSEIEREFYERITPGVPPLPPARVDCELNDGDEIELDGGALVVHAPGHTAGSIALYVPKRRQLFLGDAAARMPEGQLIVGVFNVDPEQTRASFRKLAQLEFDAAFFGHGPPMDKDASRAFRLLAEKLAG